jgi:hypothetical protein
MVDDVLKLLLQFLFRVLETVNQKSFVLSINLGDYMMPEMLNLVISE